MVLQIPDSVLPVVVETPLTRVHNNQHVIFLPPPPGVTEQPRTKTMRAGRIVRVSQARVMNDSILVTNSDRKLVARAHRVAALNPRVEVGELIYGFDHGGGDFLTVASRTGSIVRGDSDALVYSHWVKVDGRPLTPGEMLEGISVTMDEDEAEEVEPKPEIPPLPEYWVERIERVAGEYANANSWCNEINEALNEIFEPLGRWRVTRKPNSDGAYVLYDSEGNEVAFNESDREPLVKLAGVMNAL